MSTSGPGVTEVELLLGHARGLHAAEPVEGCRACEAVQAATSTGAGPSRAKKVRKRPPAANTCEHCGAPTGGRFAVGHDAKLKSELIFLATLNGDGSAEAWAELRLRGWIKLVHRESDIPADVRWRGEELASERGYALVEERNAIRRAAGSS